MFGLALHWRILIAMVAGAAIGVLLNLTVSQRGTLEEPETVVIEDGPTLEFYESSDRILLRVTPAEGPVRQYSIGGSVPEGLAWRGSGKWRRVPALALLEEADPEAYDLFREHGRSTARLLGDGSQAVGNLFLRLLKMVSIPLIITSLITGVLGLGSAERLGKMFGRTVLYYVSTSALAIMTGLLMVNLVRPGVGSDPLPGTSAAEEESHAVAEEGALGDVLYQQVENLIPQNPIGSVASGEFLSIISFSLVFGIFTILAGGQTLETLKGVFEAAFQVMMLMTMAIIELAPFGVFFLMLSATASQGADVFVSLGWYMLTVALALAFHAMVTLPLLVRFVANRSPLQFAQAMSPALLTAFSSASSNGTLPLTLTSVEQRAGVSNKVSSFVLPLGATVNMDGTALYEVVAVLFIAQMTGAELSIAQQILVAGTALLASIGAAGIPHAGLVMMTIILQAVGLPVEGQALILAVDRVLDMARTSVNVWSDSCGCAVLDRFEAEPSVAGADPAPVAPVADSGVADSGAPAAATDGASS